jgi:hypothetical protein
MNIAPIKSQRDYRRTLKEIEGLMAAKRNTREGDRLDILVTHSLHRQPKSRARRAQSQTATYTQDDLAIARGSRHSRRVAHQEPSSGFTSFCLLGLFGPLTLAERILEDIWELRFAA